jgi:hypothetical protein
MGMVKVPARMAAPERRPCSTLPGFGRCASAHLSPCQFGDKDLSLKDDYGC